MNGPTHSRQCQHGQGTQWRCQNPATQTFQISGYIDARRSQLRESVNTYHLCTNHALVYSATFHKPLTTEQHMDAITRVAAQFGLEPNALLAALVRERVLDP